MTTSSLHHNCRVSSYIASCPFSHCIMVSMCFTALKDIHTQECTDKPTSTELQIPSIPITLCRDRQSVGHYQQPLCSPQLLSFHIRTSSAHIFLAVLCCSSSSPLAQQQPPLTSTSSSNWSHAGLHLAFKFINKSVTTTTFAQLPLSNQALHSWWRQRGHDAEPWGGGSQLMLLYLCWWLREWRWWSWQNIRVVTYLSSCGNREPALWDAAAQVGIFSFPYCSTPLCRLCWQRGRHMPPPSLKPSNPSGSLEPKGKLQVRKLLLLLPVLGWKQMRRDKQACISTSPALGPLVGCMCSYDFSHLCTVCLSVTREPHKNEAVLLPPCLSIYNQNHPLDRNWSPQVLYLKHSSTFNDHRSHNPLKFCESNSCIDRYHCSFRI